MKLKTDNANIFKVLAELDNQLTKLSALATSYRHKWITAWVIAAIGWSAFILAVFGVGWRQ